MQSICVYYAFAHVRACEGSWLIPVVLFNFPPHFFESGYYMQSAARMRFQTMQISAGLYVQLPIMLRIQRSATETSFYMLDEDQGLGHYACVVSTLLIPFFQCTINHKTQEDKLISNFN